MRCSSGRCEQRRSGISDRSSTAAFALAAVISFAATWRRHTETTSRSMSSGAVNVSPLRRSRKRSPPFPSSPRATARTLASTTITLGPDVFDRGLGRHSTAATRRHSVEDLFQRGLVRLVDQAAAKVLLQRLMSACRTFSQHSVSVFWNVLDLHAWHGAILALLAPYRKSLPARASCVPTRSGNMFAHLTATTALSLKGGQTDTRLFQRRK